jgi:hypothetical protein
MLSLMAHRLFDDGMRDGRDFLGPGSESGERGDWSPVLVEPLLLA